MSFKANNVKIGDKKVASPSGGATPPSTKEDTNFVELSKTEIQILLQSLKNSTFKGEMVEVVYTLAMKLQNNV